MSEDDIVILSVVRTPEGFRLGSPSTVPAPRLGAVIVELLT